MVGYEMLAQAQRDLTPEQVKTRSILGPLFSPISSKDPSDQDLENPYNLGIPAILVTSLLIPQSSTPPFWAALTLPLPLSGCGETEGTS